ncbi:hypothetical protein HF1_04860 [Mycoplasma haemofelis str. Langford 1]|uniref:Uncharacterized protein n=1 Tax=Mycoplasma haemofelis (strain Langford 1) TaxID=941640 RepID=E8ZH73_MYCHL|nr:hypothetical protein [Mycoplasma haemofelis]CBY92494.1 hypothetical protein HF1_04860 [Mycoplasma haemofelis str. Langford 1]
MSLTTKAGVALAGSAGASTGGYLIYSHVSSNHETFKSKIEATKKSLISNNEAQWAVKISLYGKTGNTHKITINNQEKSSITKEELSNWCSKNLNKEYSNSNKSLFSTFEKWCLTPSIKEALSKESGTLIPVDDPLNTEWQSQITSKSSKVQSDLITTLKLPAENTNTVNPETLRAWCKENIEKEYISETENNYPLTKDWCLKA